MARNFLTATFDAATELKDAGAVTTAGPAQVGGANRVVNVGNGLLQAVVIVDVVALDATTGDETYTVALQASTSPTFASNVQTVATITAAAGPGRYTAPFINSMNGDVPLPYLRAFLQPAGTTPSIDCRVWITKNPTV